MLWMILDHASSTIGCCVYTCTVNLSRVLCRYTLFSLQHINMITNAVTILIRIIQKWSHPILEDHKNGLYKSFTFLDDLKVASYPATWKHVQNHHCTEHPILNDLRACLLSCKFKWYNTVVVLWWLDVPSDTVTDLRLWVKKVAFHCKYKNSPHKICPVSLLDIIVSEFRHGFLHHMLEDPSPGQFAIGKNGIQLANCYFVFQ